MSTELQKYSAKGDLPPSSLSNLYKKSSRNKFVFSVFVNFLYISILVIFLGAILYSTNIIVKGYYFIYLGICLIFSNIFIFPFFIERVSFTCPHCRKRIDVTYRPWSCGFCEEENNVPFLESGDFRLFRENINTPFFGCAATDCRELPVAIQCPECAKVIMLDREKHFGLNQSLTGTNGMAHFLRDERQPIFAVSFESEPEPEPEPEPQPTFQDRDKAWRRKHPDQ